MRKYLCTTACVMLFANTACALYPPPYSSPAEGYIGQVESLCMLYDVKMSRSNKWLHNLRDEILLEAANYSWDNLNEVEHECIGYMQNMPADAVPYHQEYLYEGGR